MRNLHQVVINNNRQVIGRHSVCFQEYLIIHLIAVEMNITTDHVVEIDVFIFGHAYTYDVRSSG
jgi:hypothetical protein